MTIEQFRDLHKGKRAFIVATGPSLKEMKLSCLNSEFVFGLNRAYLKEDLKIDYMVTTAEAVERHYGKEIVNLPVRACFGSRVLQTYPNNGNVYRLWWSKYKPAFTGDPTQPMRQGHTVTYAAMQLAYFMGFTEVYTIGLDHYFSYPEDKFSKAYKGVESKGEDINHFVPNYFEKGDDHAKAETKVTQNYYFEARKAYEKERRILANASLVTALEEKYLPRVDFYSLFKEKGND